MLSIITLITTLAQVLLASLASGGIVSGNLKNMIGSLLSAAAGLFTVFASGQSGASELQGVLTTLESLDTALAAETSLDPADLAQAQEALKDLKAGITAYQAAMTATDPSTLTPLPSES